MSEEGEGPGSDNEPSGESGHEPEGEPGPELGEGDEGEEIEDLPEEWDEERVTGFAEGLPDFDPYDKEYGVLCDGLTAVVVGHKGGGKSRLMQLMCEVFSRYVDRAMCVSSTNVASGQFDGLIHEAFIHEVTPLDVLARQLHDGDEMTVDELLKEQERELMRVMDMLVEERKGEMYIAAEKKRQGIRYRQRSMLCLLDDAGHASKVIGRRSDTMLYLINNTRWLRLFMFLALQSIGLLGKQMRMTVDLVFVVREHNGEALKAMYEGLFQHNTGLSARMFRQMIDEVCIKGKRVLVYDNRHGILYKLDLDFDEIRLPQPLGNRAWLETGEGHLRERGEQEPTARRMERLAAKRWAVAKGKKKRR